MCCLRRSRQGFLTRLIFFFVSFFLLSMFATLCLTDPALKATGLWNIFIEYSSFVVKTSWELLRRNISTSSHSVLMFVSGCLFCQTRKRNLFIRAGRRNNAAGLASSNSWNSVEFIFEIVRLSSFLWKNPWSWPAPCFFYYISCSLSISWRRSCNVIFATQKPRPH